MGWQEAGKVRIKGQQVTLAHNPDTGRWGTNYGNYDSREAALRDAAAHIEREHDRQEQQSRAQAEARRAHEAKTVECSACRVRVSNLKVHEKSARHRNAVAYNEYSRRSRY